MLLERIEKNLKRIQENLNKDNFIYDFLEAYEQPKASIKRLKDGDYKTLVSSIFEAERPTVVKQSLTRRIPKVSMSLDI